MLIEIEFTDAVIQLVEVTDIYIGNKSLQYNRHAEIIGSVDYKDPNVKQITIYRNTSKWVLDEAYLEHKRNEEAIK